MKSQFDPLVLLPIYIYQQKIYEFRRAGSQELMQRHSQAFEIENINEFRSILEEISLQNQHSIKDQLTSYLEDQNPSVKKIATVCTEQLAKKEQCLNNVLEFSLHLLNEIETKNDSLSRVNEELTNLSAAFEKLLTTNEELTKKIELIEDQNYQFKNKIQQAQTYMTQVSQTQSFKSLIDPEINIHDIEISNFSKKYSHLTERPSIINQSIQNQQLNKKLEQYEYKMETKNLWIIELEQQIKKLNEKILILESQLSLKSSELQLSEIYFKEKLDIIVSSQTINKSSQASISEIQLNSAFKKELLRVNSSKSIQSIGESENSEYSENSQDKSQYFESGNTCQRKKNDVKRSLMQDFAMDFGIQVHGSAYSSIIGRESMSPDSSCILRDRKKSISVSTADMKKTSSKGVQTAFDPITKIIKRTSNLYVKKDLEKKEPHEASFLGLGSLTSIFSQKTIENLTSICDVVHKEIPAKSEHSVLGESSIGQIFRGIFGYATKKIVTDRIHKKNKGNLNQSFTDELNKTSSRNKSYFKGKKY